MPQAAEVTSAVAHGPHSAEDLGIFRPKKLSFLPHLPLSKLNELHLTLYLGFLIKSMVGPLPQGLTCYTVMFVARMDKQNTDSVEDLFAF